jgi:diaminopimelate decarboxylase/aspartate kinase
MPQDRTQAWVVMKFGGTSVSTAECWGTIREQACRHLDDGRHLLVVVSALSGVTNSLSRLADGVDAAAKAAIRAELAAQHEALIGRLGLPARGLFERHWHSLSDLIDAAGPRLDDLSRALLLAHGELLSSSIGQQALAATGMECVWQDARELLSAAPAPRLDVLAARCGDHADAELASRRAGSPSPGIHRGRPDGVRLLGRGGSAPLPLPGGAPPPGAEMDRVPGMFSADPRYPERGCWVAEHSEARNGPRWARYCIRIQPARRHAIRWIGT